ncbi:MAG TPA: tetratricopeptide repeat protein [Mucilaginibacter sp.]|jgi:signal transduction histidine kinase
MKKSLLFLFLVTCFIHSNGQELLIKNLRQQLKEHPQADTFRVNRLNKLALTGSLSATQIDSFANEALLISRKINYPLGEGYALVGQSFSLFSKGKKVQMTVLLNQASAIAERTGDKELLVNILVAFGRAKVQMDNKQALAYYLKADSVADKLTDKKLLARTQRVVASSYQNSLSDYPKAMDWILKSIQTGEEAKDLNELALSWTTLAGLYTTMGDQTNSLIYYKKALEANKMLGNKTLTSNLYNNIGERYRLLGNYPEAIKAYKQQLAASNLTPYIIELVESNLADVYVRSGDIPMAFKYGFHSLQLAKQIDDTEGVAWIDGVLARTYNKANKPDSGVYYGKSGLEAARKTGTIEFKRDNSEALANAYALKKDFDNAYKFHLLYISYRDSMSSAAVTNQTSVLRYNYDLAKKQAQIAALNQDKKAQRNFLIGAIIMIALIIGTVVILLRNNQQKQKANTLLSKQKKIIEVQRDETNKALADLQLTQRQLIQSEKMASLGELTAGIAHEIQNPLNFVNNFSEVNTELIDEMEQEIDHGNLIEIRSIAASIKENQQKINQHGKRADFIVKGMLQHSRTNTGEKQLINLNVLADEFLKLSFHGLRAKDKSFNADTTTHFEPGLPKVNVVQQEIGRTLLNLFNNAFYAVNKKVKTIGGDYKPEVSVTTASENGTVIVKIRDNGVGIPENIKEKIMQPFFTTKAAGEGTGLGLSLSYDMIVKGHGGSIEVATQEGEYTEFIIKLPLN